MEFQSKEEMILKCVSKLLKEEKPIDLVIDIIEMAQKEEKVCCILQKWYSIKSPETATNLLIDLAYQVKVAKQHHNKKE